MKPTIAENDSNPNVNEIKIQCSGSKANFNYFIFNPIFFQVVRLICKI